MVKSSGFHRSEEYMKTYRTIHDNDF